MIHTSPIPDLDIPKVSFPFDIALDKCANKSFQCNILSYLFPKELPVSNDPVWYDAADSNINVSPAQMLTWVRSITHKILGRHVDNKSM